MRGKTAVRTSVDHLLGLGIGLPLVSFGAEGLVAGFAGAYQIYPALTVESQDETGAGAAFTAGFSTQLMVMDGAASQEKLDPAPPAPIDAVQFGMAAGAAWVTMGEKIWYLVKSNARRRVTRAARQAQ